MAGNRRSGGGNFDMAFSRRPQQGNMDMHNMQSLLGTPPTRQQSSMNQGGFAGGQNQSFGSSSFDQSYSRRMDSKDDYFGGGSSSFSGRDNSYGGGQDFGNRGGNQQQQQQMRVNRERDDDGRQQFGNNPAWSNQGRGGGMGGSDGGNWSRGDQGGFDDSRIMQNRGMQNLQGSDQQQVVMVVPQGNSGAGGIMGMVQGTPNPFNMMQRQQPMQVIVGNLPGLNADAFGQQILAAASGGPQFGQGGIPMMGGPQMGTMNQRQQQQQRFDQGGDRGSRRFSARQSNGSQQRSPGRASAVTRRSDLSSSGANSNNKINRGSNNSSVNTRGNRKRGVHGAGGEIDRKRPRSSLPAKLGGQKNDRVGGPKGKGNKQAQKKKAAEIKAAEGVKKEEAVKKDGDDAVTNGKDADAEESKTEGPKVEGEEKTEEEKKKSKYDEFPNAFLVCKICQKVMSDGASFESHLNGRAHVALVKILEERFQKRADLLMFESKLSEQEIGIEMDRQRRAGKSGHGGKGSKNYCKMCDCNYTVNWGTHKVSMGHRVLKEYLHPTCRYCNTNFVHRMDWVNHLYSLNHLRKLTELKEQGVDLEEQESSNQDELFSINLEIGKDEHATPVLVIRSTDFKLPMKEDLKEMLKDEKGEIVLPEGEIDIPKEFVEDKAYGEEAITNVEGACCKVCRTYIGNRSDIDTHVKSKPHYGMYVSYLKKIVKYRENLKAEKEKAEKEAAEEAEKQKKAAEEAAAAAVKKEEEDKIKKEETPMETEESVVTPKEEEAVKVEATSAIVAESKPAEGVVEKPETAGNVEATAVEEKKEADVATPAKPESPVKETPKESPAPSPAKQTPQNRGGSNQGSRRGGGPRGGRGGSPAANRGNQRGGRGGQQSSPRGGARGGGNMRGGRTPSRGGGPDSNWNRGGPGGPVRGGRGRGYQR